jgi:hypothetical protein
MISHGGHSHLALVPLNRQRCYALVRKTPFLGASFRPKTDIYQDRLRTNIGNVESTDRFLQGTPGDPSLPKGAAQWARFCDDQNYTSMNHTQGSSEKCIFRAILNRK